MSHIIPLWVVAQYLCFNCNQNKHAMKNILVPTDYSETAINATNYAIEFAKATSASVTLLHVFDVPVSVTDIPVVINSFDDFEKGQKEKLKKHVEKVKEQHGTIVNISSILTPGFLSDEITDVVKNKNIDLIIMGITGTGKIPEVLVGSNATRVINDAGCPTIAVHSDTKFKPIKKVAFACDYEEVEDSYGIDTLIKFIKLFDAKLLLINVFSGQKDRSLKRDLSISLVEHVFDKVNHSVSFRKNDDVVDGVNKFVDKHDIDLIVMLPKKHSLFSSLFHRSNTNKMAFHAHVPLLAIHN